MAAKFIFYLQLAEVDLDVFDAIYTRQSVGKLLPDTVPISLVTQMLEAAVQAPNHYKVRPWRFVVVSGQARDGLGEVMAQSLQKRLPDVPLSALDAERAKPLRAPLIIAVAVDLPSEPRVNQVENICAAASAVQNLLLAAHALGLGAKWRSGSPAFDPDVKAYLGFAPDQHLIALVYIGYPDGERPPLIRPSFEDRTVWMG
jgi:nitroreductase